MKKIKLNGVASLEPITSFSNVQTSISRRKSSSALSVFLSFLLLDIFDEEETILSSMASLLDTITTFLKVGPEGTGKDKRELYSYLCKAVDIGCPEAVSLLLDEITDVDDTYRELDFETATCKCLKSDESENKLACLKLLLNAGTQLYTGHNSRGMTPLMIAAKVCDEDCIREILNAGYLNGPNLTLINVLDEKIANGVSDDDDNDDSMTGDEGDFSDSDITNVYDDYFFMEYYGRYSKKFRTSLDFRDNGGLMAIDHCILSCSPATNTVKCLKLLIENGCSVKRSEDIRLIELAISFRHDVSVIKCLVELGCEVQPSQDVLDAAYNLDLPCVKYLIELGADLKACHPNGITVLHRVLSLNKQSGTPTDEQHEKIKKLMHFLIRKVDVEAKLNGSCTVLILAIIFMINHDYSYPLEYLLSENVSLHEITYESVACCTSRRYEIRKLNVLQLLHNCGLSLNNCLTFEESADVQTEVSVWLKNLSNSPSSLFNQCKHRIRQCLGEEIKTNVGFLQVPPHIQKLILLKDILHSEVFE